MPRILRLASALVIASVTVAAHALAETRVALVIGNAAYKHAPALANPKNDAEGMAASLKRLGFEVLAGTDLDKPAMDRLMQAFADKLEKADVALVFYAGHGLQVHGRNYLVPVDGKLDKESDLVFQAVALDTLQGLMEQGPRTSIMILDACRDNPLARNLARTMGTRSTSIGRGLGAAQAGVGTLIVYATQPGNVALDGETGANSPFTAALLSHLETKGLEVRQVLTRVRQAVIEKTRGKQVPWDSSSLTGDFFFVAAARETPPAPGTTTPPATPPAATETPRGPSPDSEVVFWQSIQNSKNAADYKAYLEKYPSGIFAALAKIRIAEIEKAAAVTPPAPPAPEKVVVPQPGPPARPQRTSTFEKGRLVSGFLISIHRSIDARACQALCLGEARCLAWFHTTGVTPPSCSLFGGKLFPIDRTDPDVTSGVIRTTPAAAPAQPAAPKPQPGAAAAPSSPQALMRELMAAAEAKRPVAADFCQRAKWPNRSGWAAVGIANVGVLTTYTNDGCGIVRVIRTFRAENTECRAFDTWRCLGGLGNACTKDPVNRACRRAGQWEPYWGAEP